MMTVRNRVGPLPTHRLALRHSVDYSSSDPFTFDDSSETSSDSSSDDLSDSSSGHSSSDHSLPALPSGVRSSHQLCSSVPGIPHSSAAITERPPHSSFAGLSHKMSRYTTTSLPISSPIPRALSPAHADLLPPPKRIRCSDSTADLEGCLDESSESSVPRETSLRDDFVIRGSDEPYSKLDIDPEIQAEIDKCIAYADALRAKGIDDKVVVETVARKEVETSARGLVEVRVERVTYLAVLEDFPEPAQEEGAIDGTCETLGDLVQRFHDHTVEIPVHRVQVIKGIQRDHGHRSVATGQQSAVLSKRINELERDNTRLRGTLDVATKGLEARDAARNLEPLVEGGGEQGDQNGDDYEGGNGGGNGNRGVNGNGNGNANGRGNGNGNDNGNGNGNGGGNGYNFGGFMPVAQECTYQDFLKCQPLNFNGTEGVVGLTRWFEKMEMWNSHKRAIGIEAAYAMKWTELMKLMTEVYCPRNEIQKMETNLWNLTVKGNDLTAYIRRFQELVLLCIIMVPDEEDKVERFIRDLPDNIQGNVIAAEPTRLQDAIRVAKNLMDQKLKGYVRSAKNKIRFDNNPRDNSGQQPAFKRQNVGGQNRARA
ncbi:putative reverse transcriptase domain-containing protein [Tanacetum coccineum]